MVRLTKGRIIQQISGILPLLIVAIYLITFEKLSKQTAFAFPYFSWRITKNKMWDEVMSCMKELNPSQITKTTVKQREEHFIEITKKLEAVVPVIKNTTCYVGYCGPWLEDIWIENYSKLSMENFGVFVPLFVPWLNIFAFRRKMYHKIVPQILSVLSPNYLYVTLTQNDDGIEGGQNRLKIPPNLFVISAGGKGHVPFLLFSQELTPNKQSLANMKNKSFEYEYEATFMGTVKNHPLRAKMVEAMKKIEKKTFVGFAKNWMEIYEKSDFILSPRGFGRNSFRLTETLQLGFIPVYIYNDIPWVPYYDSINWSKFGIIISESQLDNLSNIMKSLSKETRREMRRNIISHYDSHFSRSGAFKQLSNFLVSGFSGSDLRCSTYSHNR